MGMGLFRWNPLRHTPKTITIRWQTPDIRGTQVIGRSRVAQLMPLMNQAADGDGLWTVIFTECGATPVM